ncbi:MAG TPA: type I glyceraldehyde-3-phosphate dehydrogenase [Firmicutes bacterium]|nr:type I glyceraldehyde-3-phosphate dehydrogenase [Bacillota bacterium]
MPTRIAINGFGRVGRMCLRASLKRQDLEVVAINGTSPPEALARLLKYDSVHGILDCPVSAGEGELIVNGKAIKILSDRDPANLPWGDLGVEVVIESTGKYNSGKDCQVHLANGARKVVISAPAKDDVPTLVFGVNQDIYAPAAHDIVSAASCTTNCLAPLLKVLHDRFGIESGVLSTVHAFTTDQRSLDNSHKDPRRSRGCTQSIIPTTTGAAKSVALVLPALKGKLNGFAMRVPTPNVSVADLVAEVEQKVTAEEVNAALQAAAEGELKGILAYSEEPLVSKDYNGNPHSSIIDALSTMVLEDTMIKVISWYDNEWGYSNRVVDLIDYLAKQGL